MQAALSFESLGGELGLKHGWTPNFFARRWHGCTTHGFQSFLYHVFRMMRTFLRKTECLAAKACMCVDIPIQ